jgi:PKD repeat protein
MSAAQLARQLREDRTLWVDRNGRLFYVEEHLPPQQPEPPKPVKPAPGSTAPAGASTPMSASIPLSETFLLHSRPGARRTIYLDFNGHTASGTAWNSNYALGTITSPAFDLDGYPGTFSDAELQRIQEIWRRVAEDYAPFDVDVTTAEPAPEALVRADSNDQVFGSRVVVTKDFTAGTSSACNCGGFAYVGVFDMVNNASYQPAYVFYDKLGPGNEKYVAEAISHEAGHNLGLSHDGTASVGYYSGHGSGATGWAPIMGVGYYQALVQWSKGEYTGANNTQDDFAVMQQRGAPLRADDHGNSLATATPLASVASGGLQDLSGAGVIEQRGDIDVFSFYAGAGSVSLTLSGAAPSPNLDGSLSLLDATGRLLATSNPVDALTASLSVTLSAAGQYFVSVDGVGKGDLASGYSDYGSVGQYQIGGTAPSLSGTPPVAVATATPSSGTAPLTVTFSGAGSYDADGSIASYLWNFADGTAGGVTTSRTYTTPGNYTAMLTVTDSGGLTGSTTVPVTVTAPVTTAPMCASVASMQLRTYRNGQADVVATVNVRDGTGIGVPGAAVAGVWSGAVSGSGSATTGNAGAATLTSPRFKTRGTVTFTVTGVSLSGYSYTGACAGGATSGAVPR